MLYRKNWGQQIAFARPQRQEERSQAQTQEQEQEQEQEEIREEQRRRGSQLAPNHLCVPHASGVEIQWQKDREHNEERRKMINEIIKMMKFRIQKVSSQQISSQQMKRKLPYIAQQLECQLYQNANSFEEYNDLGTLQNRLQQLIMKIFVLRTYKTDGTCQLEK